VIVCDVWRLLGYLDSSGSPGFCGVCDCQFGDGQQEPNGGEKGSLLRANGVGGGVADAMAFERLVEPVLEEGEEFGRGLKLAAGVSFAKDLYNVAEVPGIGAERDSGSPCSGFDHILAAAVSEGAADEGEIGESPAGAQFADGIEQSHAAVADGGIGWVC